MIVGQIVILVIVVGYKRNVFSYGIKSLYFIKYFLLEKALFRIIKLHITKLEVCIYLIFNCYFKMLDSILAVFLKRSFMLL